MNKFGLGVNKNIGANNMTVEEVKLTERILEQLISL